MASERLPADIQVNPAAFHAGIMAFNDDDYPLASHRFGALLQPHIDLPPPLRGDPGSEPTVPPDLVLRPAPWHLVRDPERPCVGDAVVMACCSMQRRGATYDFSEWLREVRRRGLVWPDERQPEIDVAAAEHRAGRLRNARVIHDREMRTHPDMPPERRASLLHLHSLNLSQQGSWRRAHEMAREALALARASGIVWELGKHLLGVGVMDIRCGRLADAEARLREAVAALLAVEQQGWSGQARINLAVALYKTGRTAEAMAELDRAEACFGARVTLEQSYIQCRLARAKVHLVRGDGPPAMDIARTIERRAAMAGWTREVGLALEIQGDAALTRGDLDDARRLYQRAHVMARREAPGGDLDAGLMRRLAEVRLLCGDLESACTELRDAELMCDAAGEAFEKVVSGRMLATAYLALDRPQEAREAARRAVVGGRAHGCTPELARALLTEARAEVELVGDGRRSGSRETAWSRAAEARTLMRSLGFANDVLDCDRFLARLREDWRAAWVWAGGPPPPESLNGGVEPTFVAGSTAMVMAANQMAVAAAAPEPVLISGETGTGKEVAARRIHMLSDRRRGPLVSVNCAAVPGDLFEREFFGHAPGAFTGAEQGARGLVEQAHRGTLFLDEVGDLPSGLQAKLLRVLQEGTFRRIGDPAERRVDLRVVAATNVDLIDRMSDGSFRRDLYFRLSVLEVLLPPLRERGSDARTLVRVFVRRGLGDGVDPRELFDEASLSAFERFDWPGNVRQLESLVRRACLYRRAGRELPPGLLPVGLRELVEEDVSSAEMVAEIDGRFELEARLAVAERGAIRDAMAAAGGNRSRAAVLLGVSRKALYAKLKRLKMVDGVRGVADKELGTGA